MRSALLLSALLVLGFAPIPKPKDPTPITAANAKDLRSLRDIPGDVARLVWGPNPGELSLMAWQKPIKVLDATTYKVRREIGATKKLVNLAYAPQAGKLAWCENGSRVEIHDVKQNQLLATLETGNNQPAPAFSPDGKLVATGGYGVEARLWNAATGKLVRALDAGGAAGVKGGLWPVFSPDGKLIAIGNRNGTTHIYEVATGKRLHELPRKMSQEPKFSPDGKTLAVGYVNGEVALWDVDSGKLIRARASGAKEVYALDWSKKGDVLVTSGRQGKIVLWNPADLTPLKELEAPPWVIRVSFSPDGARLLSAGGGIGPGSERKVTVWGVD